MGSQDRLRLGVEWKLEAFMRGGMGILGLQGLGEGGFRGRTGVSCFPELAPAANYAHNKPEISSVKWKLHPLFLARVEATHSYGTRGNFETRKSSCPYLPLCQDTYAGPPRMLYPGYLLP